MAVWWLETSRGRTSEVLPCRRAELEEGDVIFHELPLHVKPDRVSAYGARHKGLSSPRKSSYCRLVKVLRLSTDRLRPVTLWEPPGADPHARWCGGRGRKTPAYPIGHFHCVRRLRHLPSRNASSRTFALPFSNSLNDDPRTKKSLRPCMVESSARVALA